jgi:hypothetical protein
MENAYSLSIDLGKQLAKFKVVSEPPETPFSGTRMEDVTQEHDSYVDAQGNTINALDGKPVQAVVFPGLIKWGDGNGGSYEVMTIIAKAKVLA